MQSTNQSAIMRNTIFAWIAAATGALLMIPLLSMRFTTSVRWGLGDFLTMGLLIFGTGSLFVLLARKLHRRYWIPIGVVLALVFLYAWAELAVGVFTNLGN